MLSADFARRQSLPAYRLTAFYCTAGSCMLSGVTSTCP
jgi:hypothetical protein